MTAYRSVGNREVFESGSEALTVTKTAQALKLRHPTNRTNLMAVFLPLPIIQLDARVRQIKSESAGMHNVHSPQDSILKTHQ